MADIYDGEVVSGLILSSTLNISSGGVAYDTTIEQYGKMTIYSGGAAYDTVMNAGSMTMYSGSVLSNAIINSGNAWIFGGLLDNITINSGGVVYIGEAEINGLVVSSGGFIFPTASTTATDVLVQSGGGLFGFILTSDSYFETISGYDLGGFVFESAIISGTGTGVQSGWVANSTLVSYGTLNISSGGEANDTTILSLGTMNVSSGGIVNDTIVSGGTLKVSSGGVASSTTVLDGGSMTITSGTAYDTIVNSGGSLEGIDEAMLYDTTVNDGGTLIGGECTSAYDTVISSGGSATFTDYSYLNNVTVLSGGTLTLLDDVTIDGTITVSGYLYTGDDRVTCNNVDYITLDISEKSSDDTAMVVNINNLNTSFHLNISSEQSYGSYQISEGSTSTWVSLMLYVDGVYISESYSYLSVGDGETITTTIDYMEYTYEFVQTSTNLTINVLEIQQSSYDDLVVSSGEDFYASSGDIINNASIEDGGRIIFSDNAIASGLIINYGGSAYAADSTAIDSTNVYGNMTVVDSSVVTNNTVNSAGGIFVAQYGTIETTTILDGGVVSATNNGVASTTTIEDGGMMEVTYWAKANDTVVSSGGTLIVGAYGYATDVSNDSGEVIVSGTLTLTKETTLDTVDITGGTMVVTTDDANIGVATVVTKGTLTGGSYGMILGEADTSGVTINLNDAQVSSLLAGAGINNSVDGDVAVNITGDSSAEAWTANIFGGGAASEDITITGTTTTTIEGGSYSGLIYGGSYVQSGAEVTSIGDTTITVIGITQTNNPVFTTASSAWIVGAGQALSSTLNTGDVYINVYDSTVGYIVGGARAEGDGVANIENITITVENSTVTNNIFGSGYTNDTAQITVTGDVNIIIDSTENISIQGDIYLGGNNVGGLGSITVTGDGTVTFTGDGDCLSFTGLVSGLGNGNSTFEGTTSIEFSDFSGEFSGTITDIDEINFSGNGVMTMSNSYEVSTIGFDLTERTELDLFLTDTSLDLVGDERVINLTINESEFYYNLMDVSDEDLTGVICKVFDTDGTELGSFDLLSETLDLGSYEVSFDIDDNGVLTVKSEGTLA